MYSAVASPVIVGLVATMTSSTPAATRRSSSATCRSAGSTPSMRRQRPAEHVVQPAELARALDRHDVGRLLDHADDRRVAARVGADRAQLALGEVEALPAEADLLLDVDDRRRQGEDLVGPELQHVEREPLRGAGADAGELGELRDQALNRGRIHRWSTPCTHRRATSRPVQPRSPADASGGPNRAIVCEARTRGGQSPLAAVQSVPLTVAEWIAARKPAAMQTETRLCMPGSTAVEPVRVRSSRRSAADRPPPVRSGRCAARTARGCWAGRGPCVAPPSFCCASSWAARSASLVAAMTRSWSISTSSGSTAAGSMRTSRTSRCAGHDDRDHAAAGARLDGLVGELLLGLGHLLLHLLDLLHHLLVLRVHGRASPSTRRRAARRRRARAWPS